MKLRKLSVGGTSYLPEVSGQRPAGVSQSPVVVHLGGVARQFHAPAAARLRRRDVGVGVPRRGSTRVHRVQPPERHVQLGEVAGSDADGAGTWREVWRLSAAKLVEGRGRGQRVTDRRESQSQRTFA